MHFCHLHYFLFAVSLLGCSQAFAQSTASPNDVAKDTALVDSLGDPLPNGALARFGALRLRHHGPAQALFSPDGERVVSVGQDHFLRQWSGANGKELSASKRPGLGSHGGFEEVEVEMFAMRRMIMMQGGGLRFYPPGGHQGLHSTPFSRDGAWIAFMQGKDLCIANSSQKRVLHKVELGNRARRTACVFSDDGKKFAFLDANDDEATIHVLELPSGKELMKLKTVTQRIPSRLQFSADGQYLAGLESDQVRLWHLASGKRIRSFQGHSAHHGLLAFAMSRDGKRIATSGNDQTVRIFETDSEEELAKLTSVMAMSLSFASDGKTLALGQPNGHVHLINWQDGSRQNDLHGHFAPIVGLDFSNDGKSLLSVCSAGFMQVWHLSSGKSKIDSLLTSAPMSVAWMDDEILTVFENGLASAGDPRTGTFSRHFGKTGDKLPRVSFLSPNGRYQVRHSEDREKFHIWDTFAAKELAPLPPNDEGHILGFSDDGDLLAMVENEEIRVVEMPRLREVVTIKTPGRAAGVRFSADKRTLIVTAQGQLQFWEVSGGKLRHQFPASRGVFDSFAFSGDGRLCAGCYSDEVIRVHDVFSGKLLLGLFGHEGTVPCLTFSPDGKWLATGGSDATVRLWNLKTGQEHRRFQGHRGVLVALSFSPDSTRLISASKDATLVVWDVYSPAPSGPSSTPTSIEKHWHSLGKDDARVAFAAQMGLVEQPKEAVAYLQDKLQPASPLPPGLTEKLLAELDDDRFPHRDQAQKSLEKLGRRILPLVEQRLEAKPGVEETKRLTALAEVLRRPIADPLTLRGLRALEALERIATPEAIELIRIVSQGAPDAPATLDALHALQRLKVTR